MVRAIVFMVALMVAAPVFAQPACTSRSDVVSQLQARFKEAPVALGLTNTGSVVEVLANDKGTTWTIIITNPSGVSCLIAAGEGWENMPELASSDPGA